MTLQLPLNLLCSTIKPSLCAPAHGQRALQKPGVGIPPAKCQPFQVLSSGVSETSESDPAECQEGSKVLLATSIIEIQSPSIAREADGNEKKRTKAQLIREPPKEEDVVDMEYLEAFNVDALKKFSRVVACSFSKANTKDQIIKTLWKTLSDRRECTTKIDMKVHQSSGASSQPSNESNERVVVLRDTSIKWS
jgi:hypothetical protein